MRCYPWHLHWDARCSICLGITLCGAVFSLGSRDENLIIDNAQGGACAGGEPPRQEGGAASENAGNSARAEAGEES